MNRQEFFSKWETRRGEWSRLNVSAPAGPLLDEVLADFEAVSRDEGSELLNLTQAAIRSGFSVDTVGRMVRDGRLRNYGRKNAPRVRAALVEVRRGERARGGRKRRRRGRTGVRHGERVIG